MMAIGLPDGALGVAWPSVRIAFALPRDALGLILLGVGAGTFAAGLFSGRLIQAWGFATALPAGAGIAAAGLLVEMAAPNFALLCLGAAVAGIGLGTLDAAINAQAALRFRARDINWMHGWYGVGATAGPALMTAVIAGAATSWRVGYAALAACSACVALLFLSAARESRGARDSYTPVHAAWRAAALAPLVWMQLPLFLLYTGLEVTLGQWNYSVMTESRGLSVGIAGLVASSYWASLTLGRFASGWIVEHVGADRMIRFAMIGSILGAALFAVGDSVLGICGLVLSGVSLAPIFPTLMSRAPARLGAGVALHAVGFQISAALVGATGLPAVAGFLAERLGLGAIGWIALTTALCLWVMHEIVLRHGRA